MHEHQILAVGWLDNKPVHFIPTTDTSEIVNVKRRSEPDQLDVSAPMAMAIAMANFNK
jgi:hypothetical protein